MLALIKSVFGKNLLEMKLARNVYLAIFFTGMVTLLLELSLLREFIYIFGSTARSNAFIISTFLMGMVIGSYLGAWEKLRAHDEKTARKYFAGIQLVSILFILIFYLSKNYFIYDCPSRFLVKMYFLATVLIPSFISGFAYAISVRILHKQGERFITYIYAISTLGSVLGGLAHGLLLIPRFGIRSTYLCSVVLAAIAIYLMYPVMRRWQKVTISAFVILVIALMQSDYLNNVFKSKTVLFSKDSPYGLVEILQMDTEEAQVANDQLFGRSWPLPKSFTAIDLKVNNRHESYNLPAETLVHQQWAGTSLDLIQHPADVVLLGYGSGVTAAAFLESSQLSHLDIVENCSEIVEAAEIYFPESHATVTDHPKAAFIHDDFRGFARFAGKKYDIIALDHDMLDPYQYGFFTLEFFNLMKKRLKPGGVVVLLGEGLSWNTTKLSFPYIYQNRNSQVIPFIRCHCYFLMDNPMHKEKSKHYELINQPLEEKGLVYSDQKVWKY